MRLVWLLFACLPLPGFAFELAPCYHVGGNQVVAVHTDPHWKHDVRAKAIDETRVIWYAGNPPEPEVDLTVVVLQDCAAETDLVMHTPKHDPEFPFLDLVMNLFAADPAADRETVVDEISLNSNATWSRDAMAGSCVCDAHAKDMAGRK